jgi:hypothetical protein
MEAKDMPEFLTHGLQDFCRLGYDLRANAIAG